MKCLRGASAVQSVLAANPDPKVRVFVVWLPILPTDFAAPNTSAMARVPDPRVQQFWDPHHLVARAIAAAAGPAQPQPDCCEQDGILWDLAAVYPKGARWESGLPPAAFLNGPVTDVADGIGEAISGQRLSTFERPYQRWKRSFRTSVTQFAAFSASPRSR